MTPACQPFADLLIIDDVMPSDFSPFRTLEYGHYLGFFDAALLSLEDWHLSIGNESFEKNLDRLPLPAGAKARIHPFRDAPDIGARLAYVTFLANTARMLPYFEARGLPFIMQLYPGGYFELDQPGSDANLRAILYSPLCRKVIVTQTVTQNYVIDRIGCDPQKVEFIYGGVFNSRIDFDFYRDKVRYGQGKDSFDLCFVAHRYRDNMAAKGYDHFVAVARDLAAADPRVRFHVVGDYTADDLPLGDALARTTFYGRQPSSFFGTFYARMDAIVSHNQPFAQSPGTFDGFPTGACIEAGFHGVLNCINDALKLNIAFTEGKDIVLLTSDPAHTVATLTALFADPGRLYALSEANWRTFHHVFDIDRQLWARTKLIAGELLRQDTIINPPPLRASRLDGMIDNNVAFWREQVKSHEAALRDVDRRHSSLIAHCRDLEIRHEGLIADYNEVNRQKINAEAQLAECHAALIGLQATLNQRNQQVSQIPPLAPTFPFGGA